MRLHWHRRDLRVADNAGLLAGSGPDRDSSDVVAADEVGAAARDADSGSIVPVFVLNDAVLEHAGPPRVAFLLSALASLRAAYRRRGGDLLVVRGDPAVLLPDLAARYDADVVSWCRDYSGLARRRDDRVRRALADADVERRVVQDALLHEPGSITTADGEPYSVFSYFGRKWLDREKPSPVPSPTAAAVAVVDGDPVPTIAELGVEDPEATIPSAGTEAARDRLTAFCDGPIYRYADARDVPAASCTSRLSPHLKFGTVGIREVDAATRAAMADADGDGERESVREFRRQLAWREFYAHVLADRPEIVTEDARPYENDVPWRDDPEGLRAWTDGETGYPIVDAGMRQLRREAWMHNRVRMIVASFLTKDLLIDWRAGYDWFRRKLVDHDTANDVGGWQWAASTGTDAQPYFRIFNPTTQGERYDPDAEYVQKYVPELRDVPAAEIHDWPELTDERRASLAPDYFAPVVDHADARERALAAFEAARGDR
ncbi:MAG: deoxyribodipyrimidine photo-lyase [Haloarculaceae archaeon]